MSGSSVATDRRQRARLEMNDGTVLVLDRDTEIEMDPTPASRVLHIKHGVVVADVAHVDGAPPARILTEQGEVVVVGTELTVTATDDTTDVQVMRGSVRTKAAGGKDIDVEAGQEALMSANGIDVGPSTNVTRAGGGSELLGEHAAKNDAVGAVGELRARRPGHTDEKDRSLRIQSHALKVRIAGAMARTEVEETFANDTDDDLEGIYRFPVPTGALVDRLALEVDGKLQEGAFVEKVRAEKILKGAIATATPLQRPREDIVWVPGPWRDPALLEWQQGGRFELRIFPIPKHGVRRLVLGYTQTVESSLGMRRYVYPLPTTGSVRVDDFSVDAQVVGVDKAVPVRVRGYDLASSGEHMTFHEASFSPSGDLVIEYALPNRQSELSSWTFDTGDGRFVAMAIRPHLPPSAEARPRDWVVVVDAGRSMFGERFARASRVAVALAQTLDRRDRVTVLACDVVCRRNATGFLPAGATASKAVGDFLAPLVPDGASDLASAVRSASDLGSASRELRVVLVSDGVASAGYKRPTRIAAEVRDATSKTTSVFAVPIGSDADEAVLAEIARGGGGVVVPYSPGEGAEDVALALAGAGAGALLRDPSVSLPRGLEGIAPNQLPTLRVGAEMYVVAKMTESHVTGDVVLRGTAGDAPFEARYPVDLAPTTDVGNAFVPRLYAATRIRDLERDVGDTSQTEAITLSKKFSVPSRFTSLLVLESEAMFRAFGIEHAAALHWTGEVASSGTDVSVGANEVAEEEKTGGLGLLGAGHGGGGSLGNVTFDDLSTPAAEKASAAPVATSSVQGQAGPAPIGRADFDNAPRRRDGWGFRRPGRFMRRVFHREATVASFDGSFVDAADRVTTARTAAAVSPDDRGKQRELARALMRRGALDDLEQVLADWQKRDPLDVDAIAIRSELLSSRGDRGNAARVLSGVALSGDPARLDDLALGAERSNDDTRACALRVAAAESKPEDAVRVARAVRCERARGRNTSAERWLAEAGTRRSAVESALAKLDDTSAVTGDVVVDASWSTGTDLDVAVLDPSGQRLGWLAGRGRVADATSRSHEKLGVTSAAGGTFLVEIARSDRGTEPVSGFVNVTAFGMSKRVPFVLTGQNTRVARVDVRWTSELVPIDDVTTEVRGNFDGQVARARVNAVSLASCSVQEGPFGAGSAAVTFDPSSGTVSSVVVAPPFSSGRPSACITRMLHAVSVAPFNGSSQTVTRNFVIAP